MMNKTIKVPTGHICIMDGELGKSLEFLSIGDYGKQNNIKADFMGLSEEINGVRHTDMLPLTEKWVITISSQYGCSMGCTFCDVPKVGSGINATFKDLLGQVNNAIDLHPEITTTKRLNLHYARMGEPTYNFDVIASAYWLAHGLKTNGWGFHPVVSTMMPKHNRNLEQFLRQWLDLKDNLEGEAGLQLSINTTNSVKRSESMPQSMDLMSISHMMQDILEYRETPKGRKITLNFAVCGDEIDAKLIRCYFSPSYFICKLTPMHDTTACKERGIKTAGGYESFYPYQKIEQDLKAQGFDVIVFVPSKEEDESRITCGNAILSDNN